MDQGEELYKEVLRTYFLPFLLTEKATILLSGRRPLVREIQQDSEMKHALRFQAKLVEIERTNLGELLRHRFRKLAEESFFKKYLINTLKLFYKEEIIEEACKKDILGFNDNFYTNLLNITGRNIVMIEEMFSDLYKFQEKNRDKPVNFNDDFFESYILCIYKYKNQLLDIVSLKTQGLKKKHLGNSIYQIVLEYFYEHDTVDEYFYNKMADYGITRDHANAALFSLSHEPYGLLDPHHIYDEHINFEGQPTIRQYEVNGKLRAYIHYIIPREIYYEKLTERIKAEFPEKTIRIKKSERRFLEREG